MPLMTRRTTPEERTFVGSMERWQAVAKIVTAGDRRFGGAVTKLLEGRAPRDPAVELTFSTKEAAVIMEADRRARPR